MRALLALVVLAGCHALDEAPEYFRERVEVTGDDLDAAPRQPAELGPLDLTVTGYDAESAPFLDAILDVLEPDVASVEFQGPWASRGEARRGRPSPRADRRVTIACRPTFSASPWNPLVAFPGMIPFLPVWLGYGYTARLALDWSIDADGARRIEGHRDIEVAFREKNARRSAIFHLWPSTGFFGTQFVLGLVLAPTFLVYDEDATPLLVHEIGPRLGATVAAALGRDLERALSCRRRPSRSRARVVRRSARDP
ncbi:MAG TPA: hypothetical protein VFF73_36870 [Planctomycetota bacterium]|nr:hypothetical protein [Planctomycetota bacterium]